MKKVYGVSPDKQTDSIDKLCFGKCGKVAFAGATWNGMSFLICRHEECQYKEDELPMGTTKVNGTKYEFVIRKLKEV